MKEELEEKVEELNRQFYGRILDSLKNRTLWFTIKNDPTYEYPPFYYEVDKYRDPIEDTMKKIAKECISFIGDGAYNEEEAIQMWMDQRHLEGVLSYDAYDRYLMLQSQKPVVDDLDVYTARATNKLKEEPVCCAIVENKTLKESEFANEDLLNDFTQYVANNAVELKDGLYEIEVPTELGYDKILNIDMLKKAYMKVKKLLNLDNGNTSIIFESKKVKSNNDSNILKKVKELLKFSYKDFYRNYMWYIDNGALYMNEKDGEVFVKQLEPEFNIKKVKVQKSVEGQPVEEVQYKFTLKDDTSIISESKKKLKEDNVVLDNLEDEQLKLLDKELQDVLNILNKYSTDVATKRAKVNIKISGNLNYDKSLEKDSEEALKEKEDNFNKFVDDMKALGYKDFGGTQIFDTTYVPFNNVAGNAFVSLTKQLSGININVRFKMWTFGETFNIDIKVKTSNKKTENYKTRLEEENANSLNLISSMFQDSDFDPNSNTGKIVTRTSKLFNTLSDAGYDVQVSFDNGESQNIISLGQQGGNVNITINSPSTTLTAYASGNFEITNDSIKTLQDIQSLIKGI